MVEYRQMVRQRDAMREAVTTARNALDAAAAELQNAANELNDAVYQAAADDARARHNELVSALTTLQTEVRRV